MKNEGKEGPADRGARLSRREFLGVGGAAVAGGLMGFAPAMFEARGEAAPSELPSRPNLLIITTDQERYPRHWPDGWADANLPNMKRLKDNGLSFSRAFCNASMCSPSRACLFTGLYTPQHGVERTLTYNGSASDQETPLSLEVQNMARMLEGAGYTVALKGKWHLSKHADGEAPDAADVAAYGFGGWVPTTAGEAAQPGNFGGGCADNDAAIADQAIEFLSGATPPAEPFALVVSLANPHDVLGYDLIMKGETCLDRYGLTADYNQGISTPGSLNEDLSSKPACQGESLALYQEMGDTSDLLYPPRYVNFYAYLHKLVDAEIGRVLDALEAAGLTESTVIFRTSDHGELGLAHGLRQKMFNAYEETINVPLVISNPLLFPTPARTDSYACLVDLMPTAAALAKAPNAGAFEFRGRDLSPLFVSPATELRDTVLFTFDDEQAGMPEGQSDVTQPNHLRAVVHRDADGEWKYARYFDPAGIEAEQHEMYRLRDGEGAEADPEELSNLADPANPDYAAMAEKRDYLAGVLARAEASLLRPLGRVQSPANMLLLDKPAATQDPPEEG